MDAYIYQAALYCEDCGGAIREELTKQGKAPEDPDDEGSYDSGDFPKGPYPDGGGEADTPQHCDAGEDCLNAITLSDGRKVGAFLENDLTEEGQDYVKHAVTEARIERLDTNRKHHASVALEVWEPFYDYITYPVVIDERMLTGIVHDQLKSMAEQANDRKTWTYHEFTDRELDRLARHLRDLGFDDFADEVDFWGGGYTSVRYLQLLKDYLDKLEKEKS